MKLSSAVIVWVLLKTSCLWGCPELLSIQTCDSILMVFDGQPVPVQFFQHRLQTIPFFLSLSKETVQLLQENVLEIAIIKLALRVEIQRLEKMGLLASKPSVPQLTGDSSKFEGLTVEDTLFQSYLAQMRQSITSIAPPVKGDGKQRQSIDEGRQTVRHLNHILLEKKKSDSKQVRVFLLGKIEEIRRQILGGASFARLARENSNAEDKLTGGDLGYIFEGQLPIEIEDKIRPLKNDEMSPIIETPEGFHLFQVVQVVQTAGHLAKNISQGNNQDLLSQKLFRILQQQIDWRKIKLLGVDVYSKNSKRLARCLVNLI